MLRVNANRWSRDEQHQTTFVPGALLVKVQQRVVQPILATLSKRASMHVPPLPDAIRGPLQHLKREGTLLDIVPLFPTAHQSIGLSRSLESLTARVLGTFDPLQDELSGIALLKLDRRTDLGKIEGELAQTPGIQYCHRLPRRWLLAKRVTADPLVNRQWALAAIQWFRAQPVPDASSVKVAVIDTGIDTTHPDLPSVSHYQTFGASKRDIIGHGTHVAGIIAACPNNNVGISGISACDLHVWKIFPDEPDEDDNEYYVDDLAYLRALREAERAGVNVINLSIGGCGASQTETLLFNRIIKAGITVVAAMGNEYLAGNPVEYPAAYPGVVAVGAVDQSNRRAAFSNTGSHSVTKISGRKEEIGAGLVNGQSAVV